MKLADKIKEHLSQKIENNELSNDEMIEIIEHLGAYLNLKTIPDYCKETGISYNGVKNFRNVTTIFNVKFVVDNE